MKTSREEVYAAVDLERDYQDTSYDKPEKVSDEVYLIQEYAEDLKYETSDIEILRVLRKIAGIAVRCMENHGAPKR